MEIHGLNKTTLLDYPGHVAATLFLGSCNFRCPFCHNKDLVLNPSSQPLLPESDIFDFLKLRSGILSGICISGGEPTLQKELPAFIQKVKELGYLVKLDTNGSNPTMLRSLYENDLIDFAAMDIKSGQDTYETSAGISSPVLDLDSVCRSADYLMHCGIDYEFRTTVVAELHDAHTFESIGLWLQGCKAYYLQSYKDSDTVIQSGFHAYSKAELLSFAAILQRYIPNTSLRGVD